MLADYVVRRHCRVDVDALFDPGGRYRFWNGVNVEAILAVAGGVAVYYALPHSWLKVAWGVGAGAAIYLVLVAVVRHARARAVARARLQNERRARPRALRRARPRSPRRRG